MRQTSISLRHGLPYVKVSDLAAQWYCELKVDHSLTHGEIVTPEMKAGTSLHDEILTQQMVPVGMDQLMTKINSGRPVTAALSLSAVVEGLPVVGVPDAVHFRSGQPVMVVELKTRREHVTQPFEDQVVQAFLYGLLLEERGFDCSALDIVIAYWIRDAELTGAESREFLKTVTIRAYPAIAKERKGNEGWISDGWSRFDLDERLRLFHQSYDRSVASRYLREARGYWIQERDALPTTSREKCRACKFTTSCPSSLWPPVDRSPSHGFSKN